MVSDTNFEPMSATILEGEYVWAQYAPHPSLAACVSTYWTLRTEGPTVIRTLADACIDLTISLGPTPRAFVAAVETRATIRRSPSAMHLVSARLLPATAALLNIAADSLGEGWTRLEKILPEPVVSTLVQAMTEAANDRACVAVFDAFFSERLLNRSLDPRLGVALREIFARRGDVTIAALARAAGAHTRTLCRLFEHAVGVSPKRFARIVRLQATLRDLPEDASWTTAAHRLGYYDQAHFIREVRELFGTTPGELAKLRRHTS